MKQNKKAIVFFRRQKKRVDEESKFRQLMKSKHYGIENLNKINDDLTTGGTKHDS